jgi:cyclopropane-fatty-acyl-phospholipid synthase
MPTGMPTESAMPTGMPTQTTRGRGLTIGRVVDEFTGGTMAVRFTAYDGSAAGSPDSPIGLHLRTPRGAAYLVTAPGDLGLARAYVSGELEPRGVHPGDPYDLLVALKTMRFERPAPATALTFARTLGLRGVVPPEPPPQETLPRWRRVAEGLRHNRRRDAAAISHHYDVSNRFYELVLGPSMTYTCAVYPTAESSLEQAQENKYRLVFDKLALAPGQRLLDIGCGWGGMVRYAARHGVRALGVTLSRQQAEWASKRISEEGLADLAEVRHADYRTVREDGFDAVSSIGLTEHVGVRNYPRYFRFIGDRLRPGGLLLNHCITRPHNRRLETGPFIDRYVFPDGELTGSGRIITEAQDAGLEVLHSEDLRAHYALTLAAWCRNLAHHWDECVAEVGPGTARVWGLYMAGSRLGFETNIVQLHHVLAAKPGAGGRLDLPLRPWWRA